MIIFQIFPTLDKMASTLICHLDIMDINYDEINQRQNDKHTNTTLTLFLYKSISGFNVIVYPRFHFQYDDSIR